MNPALNAATVQGTTWPKGWASLRLVLTRLRKLPQRHYLADVNRNPWVQSKGKVKLKIRYRVYIIKALLEGLLLKYQAAAAEATAKAAAPAAPKRRPQARRAALAGTQR